MTLAVMAAPSCAVALVDVLDRLLALIAARQIEIDVGPFAALFGEEALEQQLHADRIDGGDSERVTDRAVGGRATALHQNVLAAAEVDDVPDDQEVAGQIELFDERQLALDLGARLVVIRRGSGGARRRRRCWRRNDAMVSPGGTGYAGNW